MKIKKPSNSKATKETLASSSLHGVVNITKGKYWILKFVWIVCLLSSLSLSGVYLNELISDYLKYETVTNLQINYVQELPFPIVSFCSKAEEFENKTTETIIADCLFRSVDCNIIKDIESYTDRYYGSCFRFNSGTSTPFKFVSMRGEYNLELGLTNKKGILVWVSNQTVDSSQNEGILIQPGLENYIVIGKLSIIKQPKPYSDCVKDLTKVDSYNSVVYSKTFSSYKSIRYSYSNCVNMCNQKYIGEKCQIQVDWFGLKYYDEMKYISGDSIQTVNDTNLSSCFNSNINLPKYYLNDCNCPIECEFYSYTYTQSSTVLESNLTIVKVFFEEMKDTLIIENIKAILSSVYFTVLQFS